MAPGKIPLYEILLCENSPLWKFHRVKITIYYYISVNGRLSSQGSIKY